MTEIALATSERSHRDVIFAGAMLLLATIVFGHLNAVFHLSAHFWYALFYVAILSPFVVLVLHARPVAIKLLFIGLLVTAVFIA
jgi:hypothetical protein